MGKDRDQARQGGYFQAEYEAMFPRWSGDIGSSWGPRVWALSNKVVDARIEDVRKEEATELAGLLHKIVHQEWQTLDREVTEATGRETYRPVTYSDICILMPARTGLWILEREMEETRHPIPSRERFAHIRKPRRSATY